MPEDTLDLVNDIEHACVCDVLRGVTCVVYDVVCVWCCMCARCDVCVVWCVVCAICVV